MKVGQGKLWHFCGDPVCPDPVWKLSSLVEVSFVCGRWLWVWFACDLSSSCQALLVCVTLSCVWFGLVESS